MVRQPPIVLDKEAQQIVVQIAVAGVRAYTYIGGQPEKEICRAQSSASRAIAGKLPAEVESAGYAFIAGIEDIGAIAIGLEARMHNVAAVNPGDRIVELDHRIVEGLHQIVISNRTQSAAEVDGRQKGVGHAGDAKNLAKVLAGWIRGSFCHWKVAIAQAHIIDQG